MRNETQQFNYSTTTLIRLVSVLIAVLNFLTLPSRAQWVRTDNGMSGGNIKSIIVDGSNIFAGTQGGGVFISSNDGASWAPVNTGLGNFFVRSLAVNGSILFAGTLGPTIVYSSSNNGSNWAAAGTGLTSVPSSFATSGPAIFAGTVSGGVFLSSNNGASWAPVNTGLTESLVQALAINGATIFAGTNNGAFVSSDNGASWTEASTGLGINRSIYSFALSGSTIFAGTDNGVFLSTNNGASWIAANTGLTSPVNSILVNGTDIFAGTTQGVFLSSNNGATWTAMNTGLTDLFIQALAVKGTTIFAGTTAGLFRSTNNGATWTAANTGLKHIIVTSTLVDGASHYAGTFEGIYLSTDNAASWTAVNTGLTDMKISSFTKSGSRIFAGTRGTVSGGVFISTNGGASWAASNTGLANRTIVSLTTSGSNIVAGTTTGVFTSVNNGASWTASTGMPSTGVTCFVSVGSTLFAGTNLKVYKSVDNGLSWSESSNGISSSFVKALALVGTTLFASTQNDLFTSTDNGSNWILSPHTGIPNGTMITDFAVQGTTVFAGTSFRGVYMSTNDGGNWASVNFPTFPGIGSFTYVYNLEFMGATLFAGLENYGLWSRSSVQFAPTISSFTPVAGPPGTTVTISGTGFIPGSTVFNSVLFNGANAVITAATATSLTVTVPAGATTGPVTVSNGSVAVTSASNFTVAIPPTISGFTPEEGLPGTTVTITGTNFSTTPANNGVSFNGTPATVTASTAISITTTVPAGATTGGISVTVNSLTATSATDFVVPDTSNPMVINNTVDVITQGSDVPVSVSLRDDESGIASAILLYRSVASEGDFISLPLGNTSGQQYAQTIPASAVGELGIEYKFDVTNGAGLHNDEILYNVRVSIPGGVPVPYASPGSDVSNYRIMAVPLELTASAVSNVFDELGARNNTRWRIFHFQNGQNNELNSSSPIEPGKGYWLISREDPGQISSGAGVTVDVSTQSPFEINLAAGWNQIGNPYNFNIDWTDVQAVNSGLPGLRKYDGDFLDAAVLNKMEGGFVNVPSARTIIIPVTRKGSINGGRIAEHAFPVQNSIDGTNWQVYLRLTQGNRKNRIAGFGMHENASEEYDIYDGLTMPRFFDTWLEVNHAKMAAKSPHSKDIVPPAENHVWEFTVETSDERSAMTFDWDNTWFGNNSRELYLWDNARQLGIDMRTASKYTFTRARSGSFKVIYGSSGFVREQTRVSNFVVHDAWPNPVRNGEEVTIAFSIPESTGQAPTTVAIFDMLGRTVWRSTMLLPGGYHALKWKPAAGIEEGLYLIVVTSGRASKNVRIVIQ